MKPRNIHFVKTRHPQISTYVCLRGAHGKKSSCELEAGLRLCGASGGLADAGSLRRCSGLFLLWDLSIRAIRSSLATGLHRRDIKRVGSAARSDRA